MNTTTDDKLHVAAEVSRAVAEAREQVFADRAPFLKDLDEELAVVEDALGAVEGSGVPEHVAAMQKARVLIVALRQKLPTAPK